MLRKQCLPFNLLSLLLLLLLMFVVIPIECYLTKMKKMSNRLDEMLDGVESEKNFVDDSEKNIELWQRYEFGTGVGNREELSIKNITTRIEDNLLKIKNYQFVERNGDLFLAGASDHIFHLFKLDLSQDRTIFRTDIESLEKIRNFKLFVVPNVSQTDTEVLPIIIVIICVESQNGTNVLWHRLKNDTLVFFDTWRVHKNVEGLQFFHHDGKNHLLILREDTKYFHSDFSIVDIYRFTISDERLDFWIIQGLNVPKTFDIHVCPSYDNTIMALRRKNEVVVYEYKKNNNKEARFFEHHNVTSNKLNNLDCFESGYINYLVTSGPEAAIFNFVESEFQHDSYSEHIFNEIGEISWIQSVPVNNYREESILLVELKNSSVIILAWTGRAFEKISLPNNELENLDLSKMTVVPKYGFVYENKLIKIETSLREKGRPIKDEIEKLIRNKHALEEVLSKQRLVLEETESRINKSYLLNPTVKGFWNISEMQVENLTIGKGISPKEFSVGKKLMNLDNFLSNDEAIGDNLKIAKSKIEEIRNDLKNCVPINTSVVILKGNLLVDGNFEVGEKMFVNNLTFDYLNGYSREEIINDFVNDDKIMIEGEKVFESIAAENLNVFYINGLPMEEMKFDYEMRNYGNVDFAKLKNFKIQGNLNFTTINRVNWEKLMKKIIFKNESANIPGITLIEGDLVADSVKVERLNGLIYPRDYVSSKSRDRLFMEGEKIFNKLKVAHLDLERLERINDVSIEEYVILNGETTLLDEIIFDNVTITESLRIDGNIEGLSDSQRRAGLLLNETSTPSADIVIVNLRVTDRFKVEDSLNDTDWSELDDLLSKEDKNVSITGKKIFLKQVRVNSSLNIESEIINDCAIKEIVTLDTDQEFPNLEKIWGNVSFDRINRQDVEELKKLMTQNVEKSDESNCLKKVLVFNNVPIIDRLFFKILNDDISSIAFVQSLNRTFSNVRFQNLRVNNLQASEILPINVNDENLEEFKRSVISKTKKQELIGNYDIDYLETNIVNTRTIDGIPIEELESLRIFLDSIYDKIIDGNITIGNLSVEGKINANSVNGKQMNDLYDTIGTIIFTGDVYVKNLIVQGFVNGINFTNFVDDSVVKTDRDVVVTGKKSFKKIRCESLAAAKLNGKSVDRILDPDKNQTLSGSIVVNGSVEIVDRLETDGKIGEIPWNELRERFRRIGNNSYSLNGNILFLQKDAEIDNVIVEDEIEGVKFDDFLKSVVYKNSKNVTIYGPIIFKDAVSIAAPFTITESLNNLDLKNFYEHAVLLDRSIDMKSRINFTKNVIFDKDLSVNEKLEAKTIGGIDLKNLYENTVFVDRPTFLPGSIILNDVIFQSDIEIENLNDLDLSSVVTLNGEQTFDRTLICGNITVDELEILGSINGLALNAIYANTLMLTGNQNIMNHVIIDGNVRMHHNFDAASINGIDPKKIIPLDGNDTLIGNFIFKQPINVDGDLSTNDTINDIDLGKWEAAVVAKTFPIKQIVKGAWTIHGNVHFLKNVYGSDFLDGINVTKLTDDLYTRNSNVELIVEDVEKDLQSFCEDLRILKDAAENQLYKYEFFDYLQVFNFDNKIVSVHQFESENFDYLLINFDSCHLDVFVFTGIEFTMVKSLPDVGNIERWFTLNYKKDIYFLTIGKKACGKNEGNLWQISNERFIHVQDLGNVTDAKKMKDDEFLIIVDNKIIRRSIRENYKKSFNASLSREISSDNYKFVIGSSEILLANREKIYQFKFNDSIENIEFTNFFATNNIFGFRLGIYNRKIFVYYDDNISEEYLFISDDNLQRQKILQAIKTQRPSSVIVLNFDGFYENFLIFLENNAYLRIHEYRGVEGFVYRESIKIKAEKISAFKIRRYSKLAKKNCIAAIENEKLILLEAKMFGEKLDMGNLSCD